MCTNRKDMNPAATKNKSKMSVRKDKDYRKLQQELTREKEKFDQMITNLQRDLQDSQQQLVEEQQIKLRLTMEVMISLFNVKTLQIIKGEFSNRHFVNKARFQYLNCIFGLVKVNSQKKIFCVISASKCILTRFSSL
jgi:hypothetical protein